MTTTTTPVADALADLHAAALELFAVRRQTIDAAYRWSVARDAALEELAASGIPRDSYPSLAYPRELAEPRGAGNGYVCSGRPGGAKEHANATIDALRAEQRYRDAHGL